MVAQDALFGGSGLPDDLGAAPDVGIRFLVLIGVVVVHAHILAVVHGVVVVLAAEEPHHAAELVIQLCHGQVITAGDGFPAAQRHRRHVKGGIGGADVHGGMTGVVFAAADARGFARTAGCLDGAAGDGNARADVRSFACTIADACRARTAGCGDSAA